MVDFNELINEKIKEMKEKYQAGESIESIAFKINKHDTYEFFITIKIEGFYQ